MCIFACHLYRPRRGARTISKKHMMLCGSASGVSPSGRRLWRAKVIELIVVYFICISYIFYIVCSSVNMHSFGVPNAGQFFFLLSTADALYPPVLRRKVLLL